MNKKPIPHAAYADRATAVQAVALARPMLEAVVLGKRVGASGFLHIVIMNPLAAPDCCDFADAVLYEESVGDPREWDADYAAYARAKARLSWRTGRASREVHALLPHLLNARDTRVWGSVATDGIVVGVSGADPWYDEALAGAIAQLFKAVTRERQEADR